MSLRKEITRICIAAIVGAQTALSILYLTGGAA